MKAFILWKKIEGGYIYGIMSNFRKERIGWIDEYGNERYYPQYDEYEDISEDYEADEQPNGSQISGADWNRYQQRKYYKNLRENLNNSSNPEYTRPQQPGDIQFSPLQQHNSQVLRGAGDLMRQAQQRQQANDRKIIESKIYRQMQRQNPALLVASVMGSAGYGMSDNDIDEFNLQGSNDDTSKVETYKVKLNENLTEISKKFSVSINDLKKWNNIKNENIIDVGQSIIVSDPDKPIKYEKFISYPSYGASTGWNTRNLNHSKEFESTTASSGYEVGRASLGGYDVCNFSGSLLDAVKVDPELIKLQKEIISEAKNNPNYGKYNFYFSGYKVVGFGGQRWRSPEESWSSVSRKNPLLHKSTWMVAANTLTWVLRNATVKYFVEVDANGEIKIQYRVHDRLDLSGQEKRSEDYNNISEALGFGYHTLLGGNANMQTRATWSVIEK